MAIPLANLCFFSVSIKDPVFFIPISCGSAGKGPACNAGDLGLIPELGRSLGEGKGTHSSILAWTIPWTV